MTVQFINYAFMAGVMVWHFFWVTRYTVYCKIVWIMT